MPETFEGKLRAENPALLAALVELLGSGFTFRDGHEYDMALEWASRAFQAGREAAAQAVLDEAAALGWEDDALTTYADAARLARGGTASSTKAHDAAQAIEATLAAREAQGCTYVRIADVRQTLSGDR